MNDEGPLAAGPRRMPDVMVTEPSGAGGRRSGDDVVARVARALDALQAGDTDLAEGILEDLERELPHAWHREAA